MTAIEQATIERTIGCTANIVDRHKCLAAIAYADSRGIRDEAVSIIMQARFGWLGWLTVTQREWQGKTRNPNKARHHDSISLREKYVRCHA